MFCSLQKVVRVLWYHSSCYDCIHLTVIFKTVVAKIWLRNCKKITVLSDEFF